MLAACASSPAPELITSLYVAHDLQAQDGALYLETSTGHVVRISGTGPGDVLYDTGCPGLKLEATSIYFYGPQHDDGTCDLMSAPLAGGSPTTLVASFGPAGFAVNAAQLTAEHATQLFSIPRGGGSAAMIGDAGSADLAIDNLAVDDTSIYDTTHIRAERLEGFCEQRKLDGTLVARAACPTNGRMTVADGTFYLQQACIQDMVCGAIYAFSFSGPQHEITHRENEFLYAVRAHGHHLYWAEGPRIVRANLDGGDPTVIYEGSDDVGDLAVDDTDVYFTTNIALYRTRN